jgi:predicted  nucleic acid-binding Zn-ribbon protein
LELEYEESIRKTDCIIKDEETRRLRLKILLLEDENNNLHNQLAFEDDRVDGLECEIVDLQKKLEETDAESHRYQGEIWSQARELNNMKV